MSAETAAERIVAIQAARFWVEADNRERHEYVLAIINEETAPSIAREVKRLKSKVSGLYLDFLHPDVSDMAEMHRETARQWVKKHHPKRLRKHDRIFGGNHD